MKDINKLNGEEMKELIKEKIELLVVETRERTLDELKSMLPNCDMIEIEHLICLMEKVKGNNND